MPVSSWAFRSAWATSSADKPMGSHNVSMGQATAVEVTQIIMWMFIIAGIMVTIYSAWTIWYQSKLALKPIVVEGEKPLP